MGKKSKSKRQRSTIVGATSGRPVVSMIDANVGELKLTPFQQAIAQSMYKRTGTGNCCMICGDTEKLIPISQGFHCEFCYNFQRRGASSFDVDISNPVSWIQFMRM